MTNFYFWVTDDIIDGCTYYGDEDYETVKRKYFPECKEIQRNLAVETRDIIDEKSNS